MTLYDDYVEQDDAPEEGQETPTFPVGRMILWMVVFSIGALFVPLYLALTTIQTENSRLLLERDALQTQLDAQANGQPSTLEEEFAVLRERLVILQPVHDQLVAEHVNLPDILAVIGQYDAAALQVTSVVQRDNTLVVMGRASGQNVVMQYVAILRESAQFTQVEVESISLATLPTPTPQPEIGTQMVAPVTSAEFSIIVTLS